MSGATAGKGKKTGLVTLGVASAKIITVTVKIREVLMNERNLTMARFRQLPILPMIDEEKVELTGLIWGWVNYDTDPGYRSFIVQFGDDEDGELCRSIIEWNGHRNENPSYIPKPTAQFENTYDCFLRNWVYLSAIDGSLTLPEKAKRNYWSEYDGDPWCFSRQLVDSSRPFSNRKHWLWHEHRSTFFSALRPEPSDRWERVQLSAEQVRDNARSKLRDIYKAITGYDVDKYTKDQFLQGMSRCEDEYIDYWKRWHALIDQLRGVKQLFIAT